MKWLIPVGVGASLLFSACGSSTAATTTTVVNMESTNYHTLPPTQSTVPTTTKVPVGTGTGADSAPGSSTPQGGTVAGEQHYTIVATDVPFTVARKYGVTLDALNLANAGTSGYGAFYPGLVIKIPAGAKVPPPTTTAPVTPGQTTTTLKGGGSNCGQGTYTIVGGDLPGVVAKKFQVTVAQLDAANVNTAGYKSFIVGVKIIIPPKTGTPGC
ncbi:MAG: LysM peptidoglycan-binding domain-containing protein [Actinomycetota bacterium]